MTSFRSLLVAALSVMLTTVLVAQETKQKERDKDPGRDPARRAERKNADQADDKTAAPSDEKTGAPAHRRNTSQIDSFLVSCLKTENQHEIAIAQIAVQRASNQEVKSFAQQMIKDHTDCLSKLERFGSRDDRTSRQPDASRQPEATARKTTRESDATTRTDGAAPRGEATAQNVSHGAGATTDQLMQIKQELSDRCLATAKRELGQKEGKEFDKCFMVMQVVAHLKMVDTLTVFQKHASPELQKAIGEGLEATEQHLEHAKELCKQVDQESGSKTDRRKEEKTTSETKAPAKTGDSSK